MKHDNIQLRPTALWVIFGPVLGCMWLAAVNYSNNLVYADSLPNRGTEFHLRFPHVAESHRAAS